MLYGFRLVTFLVLLAWSMTGCATQNSSVKSDECPLYAGAGVAPSSIRVEANNSTLFDSSKTSDSSMPTSEGTFKQIGALDAKQIAAGSILHISVGGKSVYDGPIDPSKGEALAVNKGFDGVYRLDQGFRRGVSGIEGRGADTYAQLNVSDEDLQMGRTVLAQISDGSIFIVLKPVLRGHTLRLRGRGLHGHGDLYLGVK